MRLLKITGLSIAAAATLAVGVSPALARPHRPHKVCKTEWHHHRAVRVCHWIR